MRPQDLDRLSEKELIEFLHDRLWRHVHTLGGRFDQDEYELVIAAWETGDQAFRNRLDRAIGHLLEKAVLSRGAFAPDPALPVVMRCGCPSALAPLRLMVEEIDHRGCRHDPVAAQHHQALLFALAAAQPDDVQQLWIWRDQLHRVLGQDAAPSCARAVVARFAHVAPGEVLPRLSEILDLVSSDSRPDRFTLLLRPFLVANRSRGFATRLGRACRHVDPTAQNALKEAVRLITKDEAMAEAFGKGSESQDARQTLPEKVAAPPGLVPPDLLAQRSTGSVGQWCSQYLGRQQ